jgi:hypothetical protein
MKRIRKLLLIAIATFAVGLCSVAGWLYCRESHRIEVHLPHAHWEPLFFKLINRTTELAGLPELRKTVVSSGDIEVRFWHGFGLADLEGVILKRNAGEWTAYHVQADDYVDPNAATITELQPPKSDFDGLWNKLEGLGITTIKDASEINCEVGGIDGQGYVVEINQDHTYRTYMYSFGRCPEANLVEKMDVTIGLEFTTEHDKCTDTEWFGCADIRLKYFE